MNKSKFLKKSLAMLLALMLVVAMIPLSAAAADLGISQIRVVAGGETVTLTKSADGGSVPTYTGTIPNTASNFQVQVMANNETDKVYFENQTEATTSWEEVTAKVSGTKFVTTSALAIGDYETDEGVVVNMKVGDTSDTMEFRVVLTRGEVSVDTTFTELEVWAYDTDASAKPPIPQLGSYELDGTTIKITMPYGSNAEPYDEYRIGKLTLSNSAATAAIGSQTVTAGTTVVANNTKMTVTAGNGQTTTYTFKITVAPGTTEFTTTDALDSVVFSDTTANSIAVLLPYGTSATENRDKNGNITVIPEFELDYSSAKAYWSTTDSTTGGFGTALTSGDTEVVVAAANVDTNRFSQFAQSTGVNDSWDGRKAQYGTQWASFVPGGAGTPVAGYVNVVYSDKSYRQYKVYFFETRENNEAVISNLTIGSETATIDQDAKTIDITLPAGTSTNLNNTAGSASELTITASDEADITVPADTTITFGDVPTDSGRHISWDQKPSKAVNASASVILRVASEDTLTTTNYTLNVEVAKDYVAPQITSMRLVSPDDEEAKVNFDATTNTYVFTVPYSKTKVADLANWTLFYSKTVGATAKDDDGNVLPVSGTKLLGDGTESYIPTPGTNKPGEGITVTAKGADGVMREAVYYIQIDRAVPSDVSTLVDFDLTSAENRKFENVTKKNTYYGDVTTSSAKKGEVVVTLPWSDYQDKSLRDSLGALVKLTDDKSKLFIEDVNGHLHEIADITETEDGAIVPSAGDIGGGTGLTAFGHKSDAATPDPLKLVVLSERTWVSMQWTDKYIYNWQRQANADNKLTYTVYDFYIDQALAEDEGTLSSLTLVDQTGWTAPLSINVSEGLISGTIPYALTSAGTETKVYLDYTVSNRAYVLAADTSAIAAKKANTTDTRDTDANAAEALPTAGTTNKDARYGVFNDVSDYSKLSGVQGAYLIIKRNGDVTVYGSDNNPLTGVESNMIAVCNEDGQQDYRPYTFDLTVADATKTAEFESFSINGFQGVIDNDTSTITVTLPYGTEYTYLTPEFTLSSGATVRVDDPTWANVDLISGENAINFSTARKFTVTAEDETTKTVYTVKVAVSKDFVDVTPDDWFYDNVMGAVENDYMSGYGDGTFRPKNNITRAEFASLVAKVMGFDENDEITVDTSFADVPADFWGAKAIAFCAVNEYMNGDPNGNFRPNDKITRQEAASVLVNIFDLTETTTEKFTDDAKIAEWAKENVYLAKAAGLMNGDAGTGNFRPSAYITRAESASIMMNANSMGLID